VSLRPRAGGQSSAAGLGSTEANTIATVTIDRPPSSDGSSALRLSSTATSVSTVTTVEPLAATAAAVGQQTATTIAAASSSSPFPHPLQAQSAYVTTEQYMLPFLRQNVCK